MRQFTLALAATTALTLSAGAAVAQDWRPMDARRAQLEQRIDGGVQSGQLNRDEAMRLRAEFRDLSRLEARYRSDGLSNWERQDLDQRFDRLSAQIRFERRDDERRGEGYRGQGARGDDRRDDREAGNGWERRDWYGGRGWTDNRGRWVGISERKAQLDRRIEQGVRSGQLTRSEASRMRGEFDRILGLERQYRVNGLSVQEREALDRRFDRLASMIRAERRDSQRY